MPILTPRIVRKGGTPAKPSIKRSRESLIRKTRDLSPKYVQVFSYIDLLDNDPVPFSTLRLHSEFCFLTLNAVSPLYNLAGLNLEGGLSTMGHQFNLPMNAYNQIVMGEKTTGEAVVGFTRLGAFNYKLELAKAGIVVEIDDVPARNAAVAAHAALTASHGQATIEGIAGSQAKVDAHAALSASHGVSVIADDAGKGARVYNNAAISIPNGVWTALSFNSEQYDQDNCHESVTNPSRLTCNTAGKYMITGHVFFDLDFGKTGDRDVAIRLNNTTDIARIHLDASYYAGYSISTIMDMAVNDYVQLRAYQTSGAALNISYLSAWTPYFAMQRISA